MAEEKAAASAEAAAPAASGQKPILFIILAVINMAVVAGVGFMIYKAKQDDAATQKIEHVHNGEAAAGEHGAAAEGEHGGGAHGVKSDVPQVVPLETFIVNLAGSKGRRVARVNMELEVKNEGGVVAEEIDKRKAQIRDIIIIILSSKTFDEVSNPDGKASLKNEVKDTLNSFLTKGKVSNVFFSDFIYN